MKPITFFFLVFYTAAVVFDCVLITFQPDSPFRFLTKGILMPLLFLTLVFEIEHTDKWVSVRLICGALLCALIGDIVLLLGDTKGYFALGLGFFLLTHICYIIFFYRKRPFRKKDSMFLSLMSFGVLGLVLLEIVCMWEKMEKQDLEIPVILYSFTIGFMLLCAANLTQSRRLAHNALRYFLPGAFLFVISDSIIGLNRFYLPRPISGIYIMITYAVAQLLIVWGAILFIRKKST